ncbi:acetyltransferase [Catellatospora sp. IY07-71]|uniref:GNAT family N-acetyltransferase n=1 Tax=Catellatospora sp. IY07-71 TaxID=2728827 RepID=UPI001BB44FF3|nr:GNAT family N-acetyltransferase [Catellatospora sp. IY07-71]BCJ71462.1 acetyltransferase [Catellatospora sp. IY07-71]
MAELVAPTMDLHVSWLSARDEFVRAGEQLHGGGPQPDDDVTSPLAFAAWLKRLAAMSDDSFPVAAGLVHATYWWIVEDGEVLGSISLRHRLNEFLLEAGGQIGYSVRPSARRRGLASWALGEVLGHARARGLDRVMISCKDDNPGSARTIERNGGVLEDVRETPLGLTRRYWIDLAARP